MTSGFSRWIKFFSADIFSDFSWPALVNMTFIAGRDDDLSWDLQMLGGGFIVYICFGERTLSCIRFPEAFPFLIS